MKSMKSCFQIVTVAALLLTFGACSSAPAQKSQSTQVVAMREDITASANTSKESSASSQNVAQNMVSQNLADTSSTMQPLKEAVDQLLQAADNTGFQVRHLEWEKDEAECLLITQNGNIEVTVESFASASDAEREFLKETSDAHPSYITAGKILADNTGALQVLTNSINGQADIEAWKAENSCTYSLEDVPSGQLNAVLGMMESLGFQSR